MSITWRVKYVKNLQYHTRKFCDVCRSPCINMKVKPVGKWTTWGKKWTQKNGFNMCHNTVCLQMNGAVSKANKKFISHLTWAQRTPSTAATGQVSHTLPAVRFSCLLRGRGVSVQDGTAAGKGFLCAPFWGVQICDYSAACSAVHGLEKTHHAWCVFSKPCFVQYTEWQQRC